MATLTPPPFTVNIAQALEMGTVDWQQQVFVKLYTGALATGFFAQISDRDWKTLCVLALHMDAQGQCYPSRDAIARALGVNKSTASDRIQSLLAFRWQGQPIVQATRGRQSDGTLGRQVYTILPIAPFGFGPDTARHDPAISSSKSDLSISPAMSGNPDMDTIHHVGVSQLGLFQLGESRPLQTRSRINKIQGKQDPRSRKKDLPPDPSTPAESQDLTPQGVPGPEAITAHDAGQDRSGRFLPTHRIFEDSRIPETASGKDQPHSASHGDNREKKTSPEAAGRSQSPEAKALAGRLKQHLQERGATIFARDWHLKAAAGAGLLLLSLSVSEAEELMDWALAHPYWGPKTTSMQRLVALAAEWQLTRHQQPPDHPQFHVHDRSNDTVADRNMALLRRLYAESMTQEEMTSNDTSG